MEWYFTKVEKPSNDFVDKFSDSKFNNNKWNSFAREIIQNSLDVSACDTEPVKVKFGIEYFPIDKIPGGKRILEVLKHCLENEDLNYETQKKYSNGINALESGHIGCLKISDFQTLGVETGLNKGWGALVYDEGVSRKRRPGKAAGSHGVGKKVPFIISGVNTVYYSTKNESDMLFEGKTSLIYWNENDITYDYEGWFGSINATTENRREKILPINYKDDYSDIDDFFIRKKDRGTDVIILDVSLQDDELEEVKRKIINAVLENFFVAIQTQKLVCDIFGIEINKNNLSDSIKEYYISNAKNFQRVKEYSNIINGNLKDYFRVYCESPFVVQLDYQEHNYGYLEIYFDLGNDKNKKYYCIVREHGMKIKDISLETDQSFSAVVIVKDNPDPKIEDDKKINAILSKRENAAHDEFIIDDEQFQCDEISKELIMMIYSKVEDYIKKKTEIPILKETPLDSLSDMISIQGTLTKGTLRRNDAKVAHKKRQGKKESMGQRAKNYEEGRTGIGGENRPLPKPPVPGPLPSEGNKPAKEGSDFKATLYENFTLYPQFFHISDDYILKFIGNNNIESADITILPISVDGKIAKIDNIVDTAYISKNMLEIKGNTIKNVKFKQGKETEIRIKLKKDLDYVLDCEIYIKRGN